MDLGSIEVIASGGSQSYTFQWSDSSIGDQANPTDLGVGIYEVTVTDANGCAATEVFEILEISTVIDYEISFLNTSCESASDGTIEIIEINGGTSPYDVTVDGQIASSSIIDSLAAGVYDVQITDDNGCLVIEEITIDAAIDLALAEYVTEYEIEQGDSLTIQGQLLSDSLSFAWTSADNTLSCSECAFPQVAPSQSSTYQVTLMTPEGCVEVIVVTVTVLEEIIEQAYPNIFTPNNDGSNDAFIFSSIYGETQVNLYIMDRWGNMIYQESSANGSVSWDGDFNGSLVAPGVYMYKLEQTRPDSRIDVAFKDLTVIR